MDLATEIQSVAGEQVQDMKKKKKKEEFEEDLFRVGEFYQFKDHSEKF